MQCVIRWQEWQERCGWTRSLGEGVRVRVWLFFLLGRGRGGVDEGGGMMWVFSAGV